MIHCHKQIRSCIVILSAAKDLSAVERDEILRYAQDDSTDFGR
jgi:ubiquinone biosynthesis protein COQ9